MATDVHRCDYCGLHYPDKEWAEACYRHCTTFGSCSLEITQSSIERSRHREPPKPQG
ncbi:MAG: hypothetical protein WEE36_07630 [Acidimicrobiia bacterium]